MKNSIALQLRKNPAKRLFRGLSGSVLSSVDDPVVHQPAANSSTLAELIEQQLREKKKTLSERDWCDYLEHEGWEVGDDQPVLVSSRGRHRNSGPVRFQRYQFHLRSTGDRNARWDRGTDPAVYGNMASSVHVRQSEMDAEGNQTAELYREGNKDESSGPAIVSIGTVAQSMPKGFSTGVLSASLAYTDIPREPTAETAWVFNDQRFKYFVSRFVSDEALQAFNLDDPQTLKPFARALKIFVCLWYYFRIGKSSKATLEDPDLSKRIHLWRSANALKRYRCRIMKEGLDLFGTPSDPKEIEDYDPSHVKAAWAVVQRLYRSMFEGAL